jgi:hypothetical protein
MVLVKGRRYRIFKLANAPYFLKSKVIYFTQHNIHCIFTQILTQVFLMKINPSKIKALRKVQKTLGKLLKISGKP